MQKVLTLKNKSISCLPNQNCGPPQRGGISQVPLTLLANYFTFIDKQGAKKVHKKWLPSVKEFCELIESDPILRMNWECGLAQCGTTLPDKSGQDVLDMIDTVTKTAPKYTNNILIGFPINAIFIEFMQTQNGRSFFSHERVNQSLKKILDDYGKMLQSSVSLKYMTSLPSGWFSEQANAAIHNQWYQCDPTAENYGYKNWNEWFLREFKEGVRPIGQGSPEGIKEQDIIVSACESTPLVSPQQPVIDVQDRAQFWLKDNIYSLYDIFGGKKVGKDHLASLFCGGTIYQAFLGALDYHRWHSPVSGIIESIYQIPGTYYLDQSQFISFDQGSPNNSQSFLSAVATRMVMIIKADNPKIGRIAIIFVGMAEVSSCVACVKEGMKVKKGEQIGWFMFGGSSHCIIFQKKAKLQFTNLYEVEKKEGEDLVSKKQRLGSYLAHVS